MADLELYWASKFRELNKKFPPSVLVMKFLDYCDEEEKEFNKRMREDKHGAE